MVRIVHYGRSTIACSQTLYFLFRDFRVRVWKKNTAGDSLTESSSGWWWEKEKIDEHRFLSFSRARSCALAWFARCQTVKINSRAVELSEKGKRL